MRWMAMVLGVAMIASAVGNSLAAIEREPIEGTANNERQIDWCADFDKALVQAAAEGKPIFVALNNHLDGEAANKNAREVIYRDPEFVKLTRSFVCIIGCLSANKDTTIQVDGEEVMVSLDFGAIPSEAIRDCEKKVAKNLIKKTERIAPQHFLLSPSGEVLQRRAYHIDAAALMTMMRQVLGSSSPDELVDEMKLAQVKHNISTILEEAEKKSWLFEKKQKVAEAEAFPRDVVREVLSNYLRAGSDDDVRVASLDVLTCEGDFTVLEAIKRASRDSSDFVALSAITALSKLRLPSVESDLKKLLNKYKSGNDHGRVLRAYAACAAESDSRGDALKIVLKGVTSSDSSLRAHAIVALHHFDGDDKVESILGKLLRDDNTKARAAAAWSIGMARYVGLERNLQVMIKQENVSEIRSLAEESLEAIHREEDLGTARLSYRIEQFVPLEFAGKF